MLAVPSSVSPTLASSILMIVLVVFIVFIFVFQQVENTMQLERNSRVSGKALQYFVAVAVVTLLPLPIAATSSVSIFHKFQCRRRQGKLAREIE